MRSCEAVRRAGAAIEINSQPHRLDLNDVHARLARDRGVPIVISSDVALAQRLHLSALGRQSLAAPGFDRPTSSTRDRSMNSVPR